MAVEGANRERRAVVVAGMHRSGTSVVARVVSRLGLSLPKTPVGVRPSNEFGHWGESERVRSLHDELLASAGSSWDDVSPFPESWLGSPSADDYRARMVATLREEYPASASFVIKDPRICRLVPFWLGVLDSLDARPAFVLALRNPLEVAASLERRDGFSSSKGLLLWLRHMLDAERDTRGQPRVFVSFSEVLRDWRGSAQMISESVGLSWAGTDDHATSAMDRYISADERHHKYATDQLSARSDVVEWVTETYLLLLDACGSDTPPEPERLDQLSRAVADADLAYGPVLAESKRQTQELLQRSKAAIESRDKLVAKLETLSVLRGEVDQLTRESRRTHAAVRDLGQLLESLRTDVAALREARDATPTRRLARSLHDQGRRAGRAARSLRQLGSWILNPASAGNPRQFWEWLVLRRSGLLDTEFYLSRNLDVAAADMNPLMHYIEHGARAGLDPSPVFSTAAYVAAHPELNATGVNPLYHYRRSGNGASAHSGGDDEGSESVRAARVDRSTKGSPSANAGGPVGRPYAMYGDYLAYATVDPRIEPPLAEPDSRVLGAMDSRRRQLVAEFSQRPPTALVSVIMPTHNRLGVLENAIASVQAQHHADWELIVVDDASDDGTAEYVRGLDDERINLVSLPENRGVAGARNAGLEAARGELIAYLDSDNTWHPDYLLVMTGILGDSDFDVAYCAQEIWRTTPSDGRPARELEAVRFGPFNRALLENRNYIDLNAVMQTAEILSRRGGFDEGLPRLVDWELLLRYTDDRAALAVPCVLSRYELGGRQQLTGAPDWEEALGLLLATVRPPPLDVQVPETERRAASAGARPLHKPVTRTTYERPVTIVVPSFEAEEYLRTCVESVRAYTDGDFRLIVVDNGSGEVVQHYLDSLEADDGITVIRHGANLGFSQAVNTGIEAAGDDRDVVLLNNDALVTPGWIRGMWEVFDRIDDVGLVVPRQTLFPGTPTTSVHVPYSRADREVDVSLSAHHANVLDPFLDVERGYFELRFATFFCVYIPHSTLDAVGLLNAEHGPHYRSDRLYCDMVREFAKRKIVYTPHAKLYHFLQRSTRVLQRSEPSMFKKMFVRNDWKAVAGARDANTAGDGSVS